jgi:hypothetical protein
MMQNRGLQKSVCALGTGFFAGNKKPAEAGFSKTIPTSCQKPSGPRPIILDPAAIPSLQLMDPI